jgi:hypothetical protein
VSIGELSGLTEAQLRDWLQAIRRVAALDDAAALQELDTLAWGLSETVQHAGEDLGAELERSDTEGKARLQREVEAAKANLAHPERGAPLAPGTSRTLQPSTGLTSSGLSSVPQWRTWSSHTTPRRSGVSSESLSSAQRPCRSSSGSSTARRASSLRRRLTADLKVQSEREGTPGAIPAQKKLDKAATPRRPGSSVRKRSIAHPGLEPLLPWRSLSLELAAPKC